MSKAMDTCCPKDKPPASTTVSKVHSETSDDARLSTRSVVQASPPHLATLMYTDVGYRLVIADIGVVIVVDDQGWIASYIAFAIHCGYLPGIA